MKFMNMKRFASTVMAGVMTLSLAVPAFASNNTTVIEGTVEEIEIAVVVPDSGTAQINPYGLPVSITKSDDTKVDIVDQQITTQPLSLRNQGTVPMDVNASLAIVPKGDIEIAAAKDTGKKIKVELEVAALNDAALKLASDNEALEDLIIDRFVSDATWASLAPANKLAAPAAAKGATSVTPAKSNAALATLGAASVNPTTEVITYGAKSIALFRLKGDLAADPVTGTAPNTTADPWKAADGFTATVVFSFKPATKTAITITSPTGGATLSASPASAWEGTEITLTSTPPTANPTHVPTYSVVSTTAPTDTTKNVTVTDGKFTMPDYPVTVSVTFVAP